MSNSRDIRNSFTSSAQTNSDTLSVCRIRLLWLLNYSLQNYALDKRSPISSTLAFPGLLWQTIAVYSSQIGSHRTFKWWDGQGPNHLLCLVAHTQLQRRYSATGHEASQLWQWHWMCMWWKCNIKWTCNSRGKKNLGVSYKIHPHRKQTMIMRELNVGNQWSIIILYRHMEKLSEITYMQYLDWELCLIAFIKLHNKW